MAKKSTKKLTHLGHSWWTDEETRFLRENVQHGAVWVVDQLGRSVEAVRTKAKRLGLSWKEPGRLSDMCPECHTNRIVKGSHAARFGICPACYFKEEERKFRQKTEEKKAKAAKEAARQGYYRAKVL